MSRVKILFPNHINYSTEIDIRIGDINYGGHLGNDSVLSLVHESRVRFLKSIGFSEMDVDGVGIIMVDSVIVYTSEGFYGDRLRINVSVDEISNNGCDIFYRLVNANSAKEISKVKTGIVFFDYKTKEIARTPKRFVDIFQ
jgi:4-hydroxybenzoyl-CoA thioesterase